jgi:hypothetical protein
MWNKKEAKDTMDMKDSVVQDTNPNWTLGHCINSQVKDCDTSTKTRFEFETKDT